MTQHEMEEILGRLNQSGDDWSSRELEMKGDIVALVLEVHRLRAMASANKAEPLSEKPQ